MHHPTDRITHTTAFVTPVVEHWLEREIISGHQASLMFVLNLCDTFLCRQSNQQDKRVESFKSILYKKRNARS